MSIYNKKTNFLVIDIETCLASNNFIFDLSYVVYNRLEKIISQGSYIIKENASKPTFYDRQEKYSEYLENGTYEVKYFKSIMQEIEKLIDLHNINYVCAFNSTFDLGKIKLLCDKKQIANPLDRLTEFDLYHTSCQTIGRQKGYKRFIDRFQIWGNLTKAGTRNRKANAQSMFQYMKLDPNFIEEHTGYSDLRIEVQILDLILRQKKKLDIRPSQSAWQLVQG